MGKGGSKMLEQKVTMVGLDSAGKTTILYQLHKGERIDTEPTLGFNVEVVEHNGVRMTMWDLGGQSKIRSCWKKYFLQANAVIFVVDSADSARFEEAKEELQKMLGNMDLRDIPLLVYANKQDNPLSKDATGMAGVLGLGSSEVSRPKYVQGANGQTGEGLFDGLTWLTNELKKNASNKKKSKK